MERALVCTLHCHCSYPASTSLITTSWYMILSLQFRSIPLYMFPVGCEKLNVITTSTLIYFCLPDSLKWTSALAVALAVVFVVIVVSVTLWKLVAGEINWPRMVPNVGDLKSFWGLFTAIPIMMTAYICHHNGKCQILCLVFVSFLLRTQSSFS